MDIPLNQLTTPSPNAIFIPTEADANVKSSVRAFVRWLDSYGVSWVSANLADYKAYLQSDNRVDTKGDPLERLTDASTKKHLERIRARYKAMLNNNHVRDMLREMYLDLDDDHEFRRLYTLKEFTDEALTRIRNNTEYAENIAITLIQVTAKTDDKFKWLSREEIDAIFVKCDPALYPRKDSQIVMRDAAMFGLCLSYGLREAEACNVTVADLRRIYKGSAGVEVREGKGHKQRFVLYDRLVDYTGYIEAYIDIFKVEGLILGGMTTRNLQKRVGIYTDAKPHDLRRSYAKLLHTGGRSVEYIKQQLGHVKVETTLIYLGMLTS